MTVCKSVLVTFLLLSLLSNSLEIILFFKRAIKRTSTMSVNQHSILLHSIHLTTATKRGCSVLRGCLAYVRHHADHRFKESGAVQRMSYCISTVHRLASNGFLSDLIVPLNLFHCLRVLPEHQPITSCPVLSTLTVCSMLPFPSFTHFTIVSRQKWAI